MRGSPSELIYKMTDFDMETVAKTGKLDKVKLDILNRRQATLDAYKEFSKYVDRGEPERGIRIFRVELNSLFWEVKQMILRELDNEKVKEGELKEYKDIKELALDIQSNEEARLEKAFDYIESILYRKRITMADTREVTDPSDIYAMNRKGFY